jgi:hypothetical protein
VVDTCRQSALYTCGANDRCNPIAVKQPEPHRGNEGELCLPGDVCNFSWSLGCHPTADGLKRCINVYTTPYPTGGLNQSCSASVSCKPGLQCKPINSVESRCFSPTGSCGAVGQPCCEPAIVGGSAQCYLYAGADTNHCEVGVCRLTQ